jgi:hypothetical protein
MDLFSYIQPEQPVTMAYFLCVIPTIVNWGRLAKVAFKAFNSGATYIISLRSQQRLIISQDGTMSRFLLKIFSMYSIISYYLRSGAEPMMNQLIYLIRT